MRIIAGELKGKKLLIPLDKSTRPLKDIVRESIFNILDHSSKVSAKINNSKVEDDLLVSAINLENKNYFKLSIGKKKNFKIEIN